MILYASRKPFNLLGVHASTGWRTCMLIEWLLMPLRVNLCLVASSGCLRGHLIKGNETWRGLFQPTVTELHAHSFASLARWTRTGPVHSGSSWQKGPCSGTHVKEDMPACQSGAIWRVYLEIELDHRVRLDLCAVWIKITKESPTVML